VRTISIAVSLIVLVGCVGSVPDNGAPGDDDDDSAGAPDAAPAAPDAAPVPDAEPEPLAYPAGPYGTREGDVIENLAWMGWADDNGNGDPTDDASRMITLEEFFVGRDPASRILLVTASAGWCGACQEEAPILADIYQDYQGRGARMMTALVETTSGAPGTVDFARQWAQSFDLPFPVVADPSDLLADYYRENSIPMNMFIDLQTMTIVEIWHGFGRQDAEDVFDAYVD
jgi:thiol-disulfide isomerase/thioredoxin